MQPGSGPAPEPTSPTPTNPGETTPPTTPAPPETPASTPLAASPAATPPAPETPSPAVQSEASPAVPAATSLGSEVAPTAPTPIPSAPAPTVDTPPTSPSTPTPASVSEQTPAYVPAPTAGPVVVATEADVPPPPSPRRKIILFSAIGAVLVLALAAGAVFGLYLPNTPDSVWKTGLNRTGDALEQIVTTAAEPKKIDAYKASEITGDADITIDKQHYTGTFSSKFDQSNSDSGLDITAKDGAGKISKMNAQVLTTLAKNSNYPDIYFKITGIKAFGLDSFAPSLSAYDGKWISIDSAYLESVGATYLSGTDNNQKQATSADVSAAAQTAVNITSEYLLTTDEQKAVFVKDSFVGKETVDGVNTYHYKVSVDLDHATAYCKALSSAMLSTEAYKKMSGATDKELAEAKKQADTDCNDSVKKDFKATDTFDLWIDKQYKLVYKVRVPDSENKSNYTEVGQHYTGGDSLAVFANFHEAESKSDTKVDLETNLKTNVTSMTVVSKSTDSDYPYDVQVTVKAKPLTEAVKVTKPSPVTPIEEVLKKINSLFDPSSI